MRRGPKTETIDEYLAPLPADKRAALETLRKAIRAVVPKAEECICYGVPGFRLGGKLLVSFGAAAQHCAFYPGALPVTVHANALKAYDVSKGTIRFQPNAPLPAALVRKLVMTRIPQRVPASSQEATKKAARATTKASPIAKKKKKRA